MRFTIPFAWAFAFLRHCCVCLSIFRASAFCCGLGVSSFAFFVWIPFTVTILHFSLQWMPVLAVDLDRFTERCRLSGSFICNVWINFEVSIRIAAFLDTFAQARVFRTCLVVQVDRSNMALGATTIRLQCHSKAWTVATPPVQYFSPVQSSASPWCPPAVMELKRKRDEMKWTPCSSPCMPDTRGWLRTQAL